MDYARLVLDSSSTHHRRMLVLGGVHPMSRGSGSMFMIEEGTKKRRPFFTTSDELLEEEYYIEQLSKKKRHLTQGQVLLLEESFESDNKLEPERKSELAKKLGLQQRQVAVWFHNRRARWKTKQLESDFDRLKAAYDSLLADHEAQLKENDLLRSQVIILTEKLEIKELIAMESKEKLTTDHVMETSIRVEAKVEDHLSMGSIGSTVVDRDRPQRIFNNNENSYFLKNFGEKTEEDEDGSDDGCNYLSNDMASVNQHADNWWIWS